MARTLTRYAKSFDAREASELFSKKKTRDRCEHLSAVTVRTAGIERTVCEACGRVSIHPMEGLSGSVERSRFERVSEREHTTIA